MFSAVSALQIALGRRHLEYDSFVNDSSAMGHVGDKETGSLIGSDPAGSADPYEKNI